MFLAIPNYKIVDFDMLKFAEYVLDTSPAITTHSQMRPVMKAVEAIASAVNGVAELAADAAEAFQAACEVVPIPPLMLFQTNEAGERIGEPQAARKRAFLPFYSAVESMTAEYPVAGARVDTPSHAA